MALAVILRPHMKRPAPVIGGAGCHQRGELPPLGSVLR
jgi:hypothetical protein